MGNSPANPVPAPTPLTAPAAPVSISPVFKLVFLTVLGLTIVCLAVSLYLATSIQNEAVKSLNEKVLTVFNLGCGAIIGLLGGKAIS
jgi:hypothetical protein